MSTPIRDMSSTCDKVHFPYLGSVEVNSAIFQTLLFDQSQVVGDKNEGHGGRLNVANRFVAGKEGEFIGVLTKLLELLLNSVKECFKLF